MHFFLTYQKWYLNCEEDIIAVNCQVILLFKQTIPVLILFRW